MRIHDILDIPVVLNNEEHEFLEEHPQKFSITSLVERDLVVAQNLVRKGIYKISKDSKYLVKKTNEKDSQ
jgi:hypothetical protein